MTSDDYEKRRKEEIARWVEDGYMPLYDLLKTRLQGPRHKLADLVELGAIKPRPRSAPVDTDSWDGCIVAATGAYNTTFVTDSGRKNIFELLDNPHAC